MASLASQYTGWHYYSFPTHKYTCAGSADCGSVNPHNNFYRCAKCIQTQWFLSKIQTFKTDDIVRAEACNRLKLSAPVKVHREMRKAHTEFCKRGGNIKVLGNAIDLPHILWNKTHTLIKSVAFPPHLVCK